MVIYLGTDLQAYDRNSKRKIQIKKEDGCIWLGYCGTLGHSYDLTRVFEVLKILSQRNVGEYLFIVMGDGPLREIYETEAREKELPVVFTGQLSYNEMCAVLSNCDICINPIRTGAAQSIINKHADYAASGLPVISTQDNKEYKELIENYNMGLNCDMCSNEEMADQIQELFSNQKQREILGKNARVCAQELFDRKTTYKKIVAIIEEEVKKHETSQ